MASRRQYELGRERGRQDVLQGRTPADWSEAEARAIRGFLGWRFFQGYWDEVRRDDPDHTPWAQQPLPTKLLALVVVLPVIFGMVRRHRRSSG